MDWTVYIIRCNDNTLYTGVTTELERRFREHLNHPRGAKYFNGRQPLEVVYSETGHSRSSACRREAAIKKLRRDEKLCLIADLRSGQGVQSDRTAQSMTGELCDPEIAGAT